MALEDDFLQAVEERVKAAQAVTSFVGTVQSATPVMVVMDGTSVPIPCLTLVSATIAEGNRVAVNRYGAQYVIMGVLV